MSRRCRVFHSARLLCIRKTLRVGSPQHLIAALRYATPRCRAAHLMQHVVAMTAAHGDMAGNSPCLSK